MTDTAQPLAAAIYTALSAAPPIGAEIYDVVPQRAAYPHIEIAGGWVSDWSAANLDGEEHTVDVHVWSRPEGLVGFAEARTLMAAVKARLHEASLPLTGASLVLMRHRDSQLFTDADGETRHGVVTFRAIATI